MDIVTAQLAVAIRQTRAHERAAAHRCRTTARVVQDRQHRTAQLPSVAARPGADGATSSVPACFDRVLAAWNAWQDTRRDGATLAERLAARTCFEALRVGQPC